MRERYLQQLRQLQGELLDMGTLCEQAIARTHRMLISTELRREQFDEVNGMEKEIDTKEHAIEALCIQLLLRQQPVASDLRHISAALKIVTDMERIGDQATDIAEILRTGSIDVPIRDILIPEMAEHTIVMVNKSVEACINRDLELAREVIDSDDTLDELFRTVRRTLDENAAHYTSDQILDLLMIAKYYERIGDHATNIGEWVEFSINGIHRNGETVADLFVS